MFACSGLGTSGRREARGTASVALVLLLHQSQFHSQFQRGKEGKEERPVHVLAAWPAGRAVGDRADAPWDCLQAQAGQPLSRGVVFLVAGA